MSLRKILASSVAAALLAAQLSQMLPPGRYTGWYWPFMDYPMYSEARRYDEPIPERELRARRCDDGGTVPLSRMDLKVPAFSHWARLEDAARPASPRRDAARTTLSTLIGEAGGRDGVAYCAAEVWRRDFMVGASGLVDRDPPWRRVADWPLSERGAARDRDGVDRDGGAIR